MGWEEKEEGRMEWVPDEPEPEPEPEPEQPAPYQPGPDLGPIGQQLPGSPSAQGYRAVDPGIQKHGGMRPEELAAYNAAERRRKQTGFNRDTDPTNREELMRNLAGREGSPSMQAAQAGATTVGGPAVAGPTGQIQAGQLTGAGIGTLGGAAAGQIPLGMQRQFDQTQQAILAGGAKVRGRENVGLGARSETQARGLASAQLAGAAEEKQLQAAQAEAQLRLQEAQMGQEASTAQVGLEQEIAIQNAKFDQETSVLQAQLQQQLNLSNAEFQQMANKVNLEVEAQLSIERDKRMNELMRMGVDEEIARQQAEEEAWKFKSELLYNYWNAETQDRLGRDIAILEDTGTTWFWQPDAKDIMGEKYEEAGLADTGEVFNEDLLSTTDAGLNQERTEGANLGTLTGTEIGGAAQNRGLDTSSLPSKSPEFEMSQGFNPDLYGNKGLEQEGLAMEMSAATDVRDKERADLDRLRTKVDSTLQTMGQVKKYGGAALDILGGSKEEGKQRLIQEGRREAEGQLQTWLASEKGGGMGKMAGPAVAAGSALVDTAMHDDPSISKKEAGQYNVRKAGAGIGGAALGSWLGGMAGGAIGGLAGGPPGAVIGAGVGTGIGGTVGAMGMSELDEQLWGGPARRSVHSGQIAQGAQPSTTTADLADPVSMGNRRQPYADIGEHYENPRYGGRRGSLAELDELQRRMNGGR